MPRKERLQMPKRRTKRDTIFNKDESIELFKELEKELKRKQKNRK